MNKITLTNIIKFIYIMYVFSMSYSMAGMEMFGWTTFLLMIPFLYLHKKDLDFRQYFPKWFIVVLICLIIALLFTVATSPYIIMLKLSRLYYLGRVRNYIFFFINLIILNQLIGYRTILKYMAYFLAPVVTYGLIQRLTGFDPVHGIWHPDFTSFQLANGGVKAFFNMYLTYINVFQFHFFILLGFVLFYKKMPLKFKIALSALCLLLGLTFILSGSRAILVALFIGFVIQAITSRKKIFLLLIAGLFLMIFLSYKTNPYIQEKIDMTLTNQLGDDYRYTYWITNWAMFKDHPIKGVGYEINEPLTWVYYPKLGIGDSRFIAGHAHNMFIQMLSGTGLLGTIPFIIMWIMIFYMIIKTYKWSLKEADYYDISLSIGLLGGMASFVVNGLTQWNFGDMEVNHNVMFFLALTVYLWMKYSVKYAKNN